MTFTFPKIPSNQLMTFLAVAEFGGVLAAARHLHLSQPAVTTRIRQLEEVAGVPLFIRSSKGMQLTEAGKTLRRYAQSVKDLLEEAGRAIGQENIQNRETLRLAASSTIANYVLPALIAKLDQWHPFAGVEIKVGNSDQVLDWVRAGEFPLGLVEGNAKAQAISLEPFITDEIVPVCSTLANNPKLQGLARRPQTVADLMELPVLWRENGSGTRKVVETALNKAGFPTSAYATIFVLGNTEAIKSAVVEGLGIGFLSRSSIRRELESGILSIIPVKNLQIKRKFHWALPGGGCSGAAAEFKKFAERELR